MGLFHDNSFRAAVPRISVYGKIVRGKTNKMKGSVKPVFSFNLSHKTVEKKVCIGKYDGTHSCLTAVTNTDKVILFPLLNYKML